MRTISYTHLPQTDMNFDSSSTGMSWLYGETLLDLPDFQVRDAFAPLRLRFQVHVLEHLV